LVDLHSWNHMNEWAGFANCLNLYMEILPYLDRLWLGEGDPSRLRVGKLAGDGGWQDHDGEPGETGWCAGETLCFEVDFYLTPFRPLDTEKQWAVRFLHGEATWLHNIQAFEIAPPLVIRF
jgi:hypothetical protein